MVGFFLLDDIPKKSISVKFCLDLLDRQAVADYGWGRAIAQKQGTSFGQHKVPASAPGISG